MSKRAEDAWVEYEYREHPKGLYYTCYVDGYEQAEKDMIERAIAWLEEHFYDNSHSSERGFYGEVVTHDFDSMEDMFDELKKAMEEHDNG